MSVCACDPLTYNHRESAGATPALACALGLKPLAAINVDVCM